MSPFTWEGKKTSPDLSEKRNVSWDFIQWDYDEIPARMLNDEPDNQHSKAPDWIVFPFSWEEESQLTNSTR